MYIYISIYLYIYISVYLYICISFPSFLPSYRITSYLSFLPSFYILLNRYRLGKDRNNHYGALFVDKR